MSATRLLGVAAIVLALTACGQTPSEGTSAVATEHCDDVELPESQGGRHLIGDQEPPVAYSSTPPTSGWHASGSVDIAVHSPDDPLPEPQQVSILEAGGVVVAYRDLPGTERTRLEQHVDEHHAGRVAVTPYGRLQKGDVAFTAWGVLQRCDALDLDALDAFVATYADAEPAEH